MKELFLSLVGISLVIFVVLVIFGIHYSELGAGLHKGYVTAVDQRGYIFRNYDVYFKTETESSQEDLYCAYRYDKELIEQLRRVTQEKKIVTIKYAGVRGWGYGLCHTTRILRVEE